MASLVGQAARALQLFQRALMQVYRAEGAALASRATRRHTAVRLEQP